MNREAVIVVALLLLALPSSLVAEDRGTVLSRETCQGLWMIPLVWKSETSEREYELRAVFDTGAASAAFIDPDALERVSGARVATGTRVRMENVSVAGKPFSKFRPRVRDLDHLGRALGRSFDVFLPFETFDDYLLTLDYPSGELRISKGELPPPDGVEVFSSKGPDSRPWLEVEIGGGRRKLLIDSGSTGTIAIDRRARVRWAHEPRPLRLAHGMNDNELSPLGRMAGATSIGSLVFEEPIVSLTTDTELLGHGVLQNFVITLDQRNRRARMHPASEGPVRLQPHRGTGAVLQMQRDGAEIVHVVPGSAAERAGLEKGDVLTHLDGVPIAERGCTEERERSDEPHYTVRRGARMFELSVAVDVLIP